jgi:hypothetical protein
MRLVRCNGGLSGFGVDVEATPIRAFLEFAIRAPNLLLYTALLVGSRTGDDVWLTSLTYDSAGSCCFILKRSALSHLDGCMTGNTYCRVHIRTIGTFIIGLGSCASLKT